MRNYLLGVILFFLLPIHVVAHELILKITQQPNNVRVEAYYDDDTPAEQAVIVVLNADGNTIAEGKTDETGIWSFPVPPSGFYRVRGTCIGHSATQTLDLSDQAALKNEKGPTPVASTPTASLSRVLVGLATILLFALLLWFGKKNPPPAG